MTDLSGHQSLITGSTQGVGRAIAIALAAAGSDVVIHGLEGGDAADETVKRCQQSGVQVELITGDLAGETESCVQTLVQQVERVMPDVDILINNAGTYADVSFLDMPFDSFQRTMRLNVFTPYRLTQIFARRWVERQIAGRVLMVGSINGILAESNHSAYDTSKGAIEAMVRTLCVELAPRNIRVNGISPGLFRTPLTAPALDDDRLRRWMELHTPNHIVPGPNVAGEAAAFLVSDGARHIHGQMLRIDGGMSVWQQPDPPADWR